jgi:hypothetical protein
MISKSEKALGTVFFVPSSDDGRAFIKLVEKYLNTANYKIHVRGRGPRKVYGRGFTQDLPLEHAEYFAVYLPGKAWDRQYAALSKLRKEITDVQDQLNALKREKGQVLAEQAADLQKQVEKLMNRFGKRKIKV